MFLLILMILHFCSQVYLDDYASICCFDCLVRKCAPMITLFFMKMSCEKLISHSSFYTVSASEKVITNIFSQLFLLLQTGKIQKQQPHFLFAVHKLITMICPYENQLTFLIRH